MNGVFCCTHSRAVLFAGTTVVDCPDCIACHLNEAQMALWLARRAVDPTFDTTKRAHALSWHDADRIVKMLGA